MGVSSAEEGNGPSHPHTSPPAKCDKVPAKCFSKMARNYAEAALSQHLTKKRKKREKKKEKGIALPLPH